MLFTLATFASGLFSWFTPLPLFYIGRKYSIRLAALAWIGLVAAIVLLYGFLLGLPGGHAKEPWIQWFSWLPGMLYWKQFGAGAVLKAVAVYGSFNVSLSLGLIWLSKREADATRMAGKLALVVLSACALAFSIGVGTHWAEFAGLLQKHTLAILDQVLAFNQSAGMSGEEVLYIQQNKEAIVLGFVKVLPGLVVSALLFLVWINLYLARRLFKVFGFFDAAQDMLFFKLPFEVVWGVVAVLALFLLNLYGLRRESISFALFNFLIVFSTLYFFQGFAILAYFFQARRVLVWLRLLCYFLIFVFIQPLGFLLVGLGFFDSWYDFRKLPKINKT